MPELSTGKSVLLTDLALCINHYRLYTPGIYVCLHVPVQLDATTRIVPGLISMVNHGRLRQCRPVENGFEGPPNFVLDVFSPGEEAEYAFRRGAFEQAGVTEYVAVTDADQPVVHWHRHNGNGFDEVGSDRRGLICSQALPGLWISPTAVAARDWWTVLAAIERGVTRLGHHEFQETIWHAQGRPDGEPPIPFDAG
ncbi:hypothetical protein Mal4_06520 [Maioricimonas rarisocia]|uniref:Putative restriction endonuclease domain-containing protein n=1 Tax=Maioricimonas rarisocia TaxID=2528026 RepID=A0A517Z1L0_9PLAN|nr:Uma2 family endonuclease [Maioricimonas rarisocia]QDU36367.1 hypothetical protein Mal4_06520 [Maioricimonas rarisocia]